MYITDMLLVVRSPPFIRMLFVNTINAPVWVVLLTSFDSILIFLFFEVVMATDTVTDIVILTFDK
jgi:hypothetical protein